MNEFEQGYRIVDETFGHGKDNLIALSTIALKMSESNRVRPVVRTVDAIYEDGVFYVSTYALSNKMRQIAENPEVSVAGFQDMFTASGIAENLGWVLAPQNAEIREKLRAAFSWYDMANNENDENCCILAIRLTKGIMNVNHWEKLYFLDFEHKTAMENGEGF